MSDMWTLNEEGTADCLSEGGCPLAVGDGNETVSSFTSKQEILFLKKNSFSEIPFIFIILLS